VPATIRRARTADVPAVKSIVDVYAGSGRRLLAKELVTLYEDVQDFLVADVDGEVVGCGANFFARAGFVAIDGTPVDQDTYDALRRSYDPGVAEFLGLEYVKPNTLGNTRMLLTL
jgi:amino-acid N-acetyltransferase